MSPLFLAVPAVVAEGSTSILLESFNPETLPMYGFRPRRVASELASNPTCSPAARITCPSGATKEPLFSTLAPAKIMRPPLLASLDGAERTAPDSTTTSPILPVPIELSLSAPSSRRRTFFASWFRMPLSLKTSLIGRAEATRVRALTWDPAPKMMPFWLMM